MDIIDAEPIKRKRGRPPKPKTSSVNAEIRPKKNPLDNLKPGAKPKRHIRKDIVKFLDEIGFDPLLKMVELCCDADTPKKVQADLAKELLSYCSVKPRHQLESDNINALTELFSIVANDGRPQPATAVTFDGEAQVIEHDGEEDHGDG